jgi:carbamoyltransferase
MRICGLGLGHDGAVALIEDGRLVFSVELEKLDNQPRFARAGTQPGFVTRTLAEFGYQPQAIDVLAIDGDPAEAASAWGRYPLPARVEQHGHRLGNIAGAWCASPFARRGEAAYILVWDGSGLPELHHLDPVAATIQPLGLVSRLLGRAYAAAGLRFGPFQTADPAAANGLDVAGKLMAFVALGRPDTGLVEAIAAAYAATFAEEALADDLREPADRVPDFLDAVAERVGAASGADVLAALHLFVEQSLVAGLGRLMQGRVRGGLCLAGGCGLNIKWNSAIRASGLFEAVWAPPFPNNSGAAIGAAAAAHLAHVGFSALDWSVYAGPALPPAGHAVHAGWRSRRCDAAELAGLLEAGAVVALLSGRAEIGPRALGNRSIVAAPVDAAMRDRLNYIKRREAYRPIAPVCLKDRAPEIFDPGCEDPYMLFEHRLHPEWAARIPAVVHIDGSARVQTVERGDDSMIARLLVEYERLTGVPVLCNTSANRPGRGFFPDLPSVLAWGEVDHVWYDGLLFERDAAANPSEMGADQWPSPMFAAGRR